MFHEIKLEFKKYNMPYMLIINKIEDTEKSKLDELKSKYKEAKFVSTYSKEGIDELKNEFAAAVVINNVSISQSNWLFISAI